MSPSPHETVSQSQFERFEDRVFEKLDKIDEKVDTALSLEVRIAVLETEGRARRSSENKTSRKHFSWGAVGTLLGALIPEVVKFFHKP